MEESSHRITGLEKRVDAIQVAVNQSTIETARILMSIEHLTSTSDQRLVATQQQHSEIRSMLAAHISLDAKNTTAHNQWIRSLISPQTVILIIALLAGFIGVSGADVAAVAGTLSTTAP